MSNAFTTAFKQAGLVAGDMNTASPTAMAAASSATPPTSAPAQKPKRQARIKIKSRGNKRGQWGKSQTPNIIEWSHPELGTVMVQLKQLSFTGEVFQEGPNTWRKINLRQHTPSEIVLEVGYELPKGVELLHGFVDRVINSSEVPHLDPFKVKIEWSDGPQRDSDPIPNLSHGQDEDFQLYLVNKATGFLVHLDVSIVSRKGTFWVTVQEVLGAQVVKYDDVLYPDGVAEYTSVVFDEKDGKKEGERVGYTLVPVYAENAYPGNDPVASMNRSYNKRGEKVLAYCDKLGIGVSVEHCAPAEWNPEWPEHVPTDLRQKGYEEGVVLWYNLTIGGGFIQPRIGEPCWVHFSKIHNRLGVGVANVGNFPVLQSGKGVYFKWQLEKNRRSGEMKPAVTSALTA